MSSPYEPAKLGTGGGLPVSEYHTGAQQAQARIDELVWQLAALRAAVNPDASLTTGEIVEQAKEHRVLAQQVADMGNECMELRGQLAALRKSVNAKYWEGIAADNGTLKQQIASIRGRMFPVIYSRNSKPGPTRIPWSVAQKAYSLYAAQNGCSQSLEDLCSRGGFGDNEMDRYYPQWREEVSEIADLRDQLAAAKAEVEESHKRIDSLERKVVDWQGEFQKAARERDAAKAEVELYRREAQSACELLGRKVDDSWELGDLRSAALTAKAEVGRVTRERDEARAAYHEASQPTRVLAQALATQESKG